jgi:hypothetical protein
MSDKFFFLNFDYESEDRFDPARFMEYLTDNYDPLTSSLFENVTNLRSGGFYRIQGEENRPDILSFNIYGDTQYWWILILYNGLESYADLKIGDEIQFPASDALDDFYFNLKVQQNKQDREA